jgi:hypothetical protein
VPTALMLEARGDCAAVADWMTRIGPASALLREKAGSEADRLLIAGEIAAAMRPYETPEGVRVPASVLMLTGRAP